jgi:type I restriction enzyme S subunit
MKSNWPTKKLTDICDPERGTEPGSAFYVEASDKAIPFLRIGDLTGKIDAPKFVKDDNDNLQIVNKNETLITFDGTPGIVVRGLKGAIASGIRVLRGIKPEINGDFLFYYLQTPAVQKIIKSYSKGATIIHASAAIPRIKIPIPSIKIQQKIVERLDAIKKTQELNGKQINLADELFQSLLHRELNPKGKNWEVKRLGDICEINPRTNLDLKRDKIKYAEMAAVDENLKEIRYFLDRPINKVSSGAPKFKDNDVIFARITPCTENGKLAFVENCPGVCAGSTELHVLRAKPNNLLPRFLFYYLIRPKIKNMAVGSMVGSTGRQRVPAEFFHYLKIPVPPIETQRKIVEKLSAVQDYKKKLLEQKQKLQELFDSVLNKSFKGQL